MSEIKFALFADLHYKKRMYASKISDIESIIQRAVDENVSLVIHEGDLCNDYKGSPELTNVINGCPIKFFGVYGNHELETMGNTMTSVTPHLTNSADDVTWGTVDGKIGDGCCAYYYYDCGEFRFIFLDTNYSLTKDGEFEHNREGSWGCPSENTRQNSLGDVQLKWLEDVLTDSAKQKKHCIINAHDSFSGVWSSSPDSIAVRELYAKANSAEKGTVLMSINGHYHRNRSAVVEDVFYLDVNTTINGCWKGVKFYPYGTKDEPKDGCTFDFTDYDSNGNAVSTTKMPLSQLTMGEQTLAFASPLSAIVTLSSDGSVKVNGTHTNWIYGIIGTELGDGIMPEISDFTK